MQGPCEIAADRYARPTQLAEALTLRAAGRSIIAGGTDFYPARVGRPLYDSAETRILDLTGLDDLVGIVEEEEHLRIGALTSWTAIAEASLPGNFTGLQAAAREVGGRQIQNRGTIGGNLCNASPAADGVPPLLALEAEVELRSAGSTRRLAVGDFILGNRKTALRDDEILSAILVPKPKDEARSAFLKLGARRYLLISIVMVAGVIEQRDGRVTRAGIAVGSCSPVARRLPELEEALVGQPLTPALAEVVTSVQLTPLAPIDDIRASGDYRADAAITLLRRLLTQLVEPA